MVFVDDGSYGPSSSVRRAAYHPAYAIHQHIFWGAQHVGRHSDGEFDGRAHGHFVVDVEQDAAGGDVVGLNQVAALVLTYRNGQVEGEADGTANPGNFGGRFQAIRTLHP